MEALVRAWIKRLRVDPHAGLPTLNPDILRAHLARVARESNRQFNAYLKLRQDGAYDELPADLRHRVDEATTRNVGLIKNLSEDVRKRVQELIHQADASNMTTAEAGQLISQQGLLEAARAVRVSRDQVLKIQSEVVRTRSLDLGITQYTWSTSNDSRVRPDHRRLDGKVFDWHDPPIENRKTGNRAHPGQSYNCRCLALPDVDSLL